MPIWNIPRSMKTPSLYKILLVGDLHLGRRSYDLVERIRDHAAVLPQISEYVNDEAPDCVVIPGDIFDNPNPDSWSCDAFRRFVQQMAGFSTCRLVALTGNHDREKLDLGMTRVRSLGGDSVTAAGDFEDTIFSGDYSKVKVRALDWMPAADIVRELEKIQPGELDVLCLHQSVEGLLPVVGTPEVRLDQLRGKARLVLAGDVHVNRVVDLGEGTTLVSAGSTEMCAADEDPNKVVKLISYDAANRTVADIRDLPLTTREIISWNVRDEAEFALAFQAVGSTPTAKQLHLVSYTPEFAHRMPELAKAAAFFGDLFVPRPLAVEEAGPSYAENRESAEAEFEEIIAARHQDRDAAEQRAAVSLWKDADHIDQILSSLQPCNP